MTKEEMFEMYPHKWLIVSEPKTRESDGEILGGELLGVFDERKDAYEEAMKLSLRHGAIINSLQEEA